jgi:hypothetical protein
MIDAAIIAVNDSLQKNPKANIPKDLLAIAYLCKGNALLNLSLN